MLWRYFYRMQSLPVIRHQMSTALLGAAKAGNVIGMMLHMEENENFELPPDPFLDQLQRTDLSAKNNWRNWARTGLELEQ